MPAPDAQLIIRHANPGGDAAACAAIYAPHVEDSAVSFEERVPDAAEMAARAALNPPNCINFYLRWV